MVAHSVARVTISRIFVEPLCTHASRVLYTTAVLLTNPQYARDARNLPVPVPVTVDRLIASLDTSLSGSPRTAPTTLNEILGPRPACCATHRLANSTNGVGGQNGLPMHRPPTPHLREPPLRHRFSSPVCWPPSRVFISRRKPLAPTYRAVVA